MNFVSREELGALIQGTQGPCVSMYMPTFRAGLDVQQNPIRLSNLVREAEKQLVAFGVRAAEARELLNPAHELESDGYFWRNQSDGLALFISPGLFRSYRLPLSFEQMSTVQQRFHLKPLLPLFNGDGRFYVLAVSRKQVRLLQCTRYGVSEVDLPGVPRSMDEALRYDEPVGAHIFRGIAASGMQGSANVPMFAAHGVGVDDDKLDVWRFFLKIDDGLHEILREEQAPLVVAGVEYLLPIYREANRYQSLVEEGITGNPDGLSPQELHAQAWPLVEPYFQKSQAEAADRYGDRLGTGLASADIREIVSAAHFGRVDSLFVSRGLQRWGRFDAASGAVEVHENPERGDEDLLESASVQAYLHRGAVYVVEPSEVPSGTELAAVFRY